jgi:prefoldin subunit 5
MARNRQPIGNTCPEIDGYIRNIKDAIYSEDSDTFDGALQAMATMIGELQNCISYLEQMRGHNDTLRTWGQKEAERVDELEERVDELENQIEILKEEVESLINQSYDRETIATD